MSEARFSAPKTTSAMPRTTSDPVTCFAEPDPPPSSTYDIIKLLDLEDENVEISGPEVKNGMKILTGEKKLSATYCPICGNRMYSRGIYTPCRDFIIASGHSGRRRRNISMSTRTTRNRSTLWTGFDRHPMTGTIHW